MIYWKETGWLNEETGHSFAHFLDIFYKKQGEVLDRFFQSNKGEGGDKGYHQTYGRAKGIVKTVVSETTILHQIY